MKRIRKPTTRGRTHASATVSSYVRAVLYARVSTAEQQKEGFSIPAQEKLMREYAAQNELAIVKEFIDVETAKRTGRPGFDSMLRYVKTHPSIKIILVEKTDRLYRNLKDWVTVDELDLEIHLVKENVVLSKESRSSEKFMHGIKVLMAKNYIDNLSEETRKGMLEKAEQGIWPSYAPLGYQNVMGPNGKKIIAIDPEAGPFVARAFEWFETGQYSLKDLAAKLAKAGLRYRRTGKPIGTSSVNQILRSRIYTGSFEWLGKLYDGSHTALCSFSTWLNVQEILDRRSISNAHGNRHQFAYTGLMTCGHCGCAITAELKKGRYIYYHCSKFKVRCPEPYVREEVLDEKFSALLRRLRIDDDTFNLIRRAVRENHADERRERDEALARLRGEADRLQHRLDMLYLDKLDGKVTGEFHDRVAATFREDRDRCLRDLESRNIAEDDLIDDGLALVDFARSVYKGFGKQPLANKRRALILILSNCSYAAGELTAEFREPFKNLRDRPDGGGGGIPPVGRSNRGQKELAPRVANFLPFYHISAQVGLCVLTTDIVI